MPAALALDPDEDEDQLLLQYAVRKLCLALICQQVSSTPFQSLVISFCTILNKAVVHGKAEPAEPIELIKPRHEAWQEPGNFNHYLFALT